MRSALKPFVVKRAAVGADALLRLPEIKAVDVSSFPLQTFTTRRLGWPTSTRSPLFEYQINVCPYSARSQISVLFCKAYHIPDSTTASHSSLFVTHHSRLPIHITTRWRRYGHS